MALLFSAEDHTAHEASKVRAYTGPEYKPTESDYSYLLAFSLILVANVVETYRRGHEAMASLEVHLPQNRLNSETEKILSEILDPQIAEPHTLSVWSSNGLTFASLSVMTPDHPDYP
jgi:hypothetical protein